jgi:peptide/histidine transporter 3/4
MGGSAIISITLIVYLQDKLGWKIGFAISIAIAAFATFLNIVTSPLYIKVKP